MARTLDQVAHPKATENRIAKAVRLVAFLETSGWVAAVTPEAIGALGPDAWKAFADEFGETVPGVETIAMVIGIVAGRRMGNEPFDVIAHPETGEKVVVGLAR